VSPAQNPFDDPHAQLPWQLTALEILATEILSRPEAAPDILAQANQFCRAAWACLENFRRTFGLG
jgi:hypothetical protein